MRKKAPDAGLRMLVPRLALLLLAVAGRTGLAQDFSLTPLQNPPAAGSDIFVGTSVFTWPRYPGAARQSYYVLPMVEAFGHDGWFVSTEAGAGWNFSRAVHWQYGLRLTPQFSRLAHATPQPAVADIGPRLERGAFLNYAPWEWVSLQTGFRQGSGRRGQGLLVDTGLMAGVPLATGLTLAFSASSSWANNAYASSYFSVPQGAAGQGFNAGSGRVNLNADLMLLADLSERWSLTLDLGRIRYLGAARHSPLTAPAPAHTWFAGVEYRFQGW